MIDNNFRETAFAPEDPQLSAYSSSNFKALCIIYAIVSFLNLAPLSSVFLPGGFQLFPVLKGVTLSGIFSLNILTLLFNSYLPSRYWRRLQPKRQLAFEQPESYLSSSQPAAFSELPQPGRVAIITKKNAIALLVLLYSFSLMTVISFLFFNASLRMALLIGGITAALMCIAVVVTAYVQRNKPRWPYVEVSEGGVAAAMDKIRDPLPWQDICFFTTYKGPSTPFALPNSKHARYYELASPQRIIRWRYQPRLAPQMTTRPELDQQTYDRWHQQLLGYIRERTGLPLVDLDSVPAQTNAPNTKHPTHK